MTNQYFLDRIAGRNPNLRASDADRERIAEALRTSHAEGRLDLTGFQQRLEHCYEAKTLGELDQLVTDLPRESHLDERNAAGWFRPTPWRLAPMVPILIALLVIAAATHGHVFWLWIPLAFLFWRMSWSRRSRLWAGPQRGPGRWT